MEIETIKSKADKIINLSEIAEGTMLHKIAKANIQFHGYYTYIDFKSNIKVFVS